MKHGLIVGSFMPLHAGHIALIRFGAAHCDRLHVAVLASEKDPIPGSVRLKWIQQEFHPYVRITATIVELDQAYVARWKEDMGPLAEILVEEYDSFHLLFSSSNFGETLASRLGISHVRFDSDKKEHPVSAEEIRKHPFKHWDALASAAKPYFVKKICFYGPESTGKTTLAQRMATRYQTVFVPEVAREMITTNAFTEEEIIRIGQAQTKRLLGGLAKANRLLFCDTDLITTQIYSSLYLNRVPVELIELEKEFYYDQYLLFNTDVPWISDGLRDLGSRRQEVLAMFKENLDRRDIPYTMVSGSYEERERVVIGVVDRLLQK